MIVLAGILFPWAFTLVEFARQTLMRRLEMMNLRRTDVRIAKAMEVPHPEHEKAAQGIMVPLYVGVAKIHTSKTGKGRDCPLNYTAAGIVHQWLNREYDSQPASDYLFLPDFYPENRCRAGKDWADAFWFDMLRELGIPDLHWHDIRHLGATLAYLNGAPLNSIRKMLGHKTIQQTERYIHVIDIQEMWGAAIAIGRGFFRATQVPPELAAYAPLLAESGILI
mgnify:CR=1 FL=1